MQVAGRHLQAMQSEREKKKEEELARLGAMRGPYGGAPTIPYSVLAAHTPHVIPPHKLRRAKYFPLGAASFPYDRSAQDMLAIFPPLLAGPHN